MRWEDFRTSDNVEDRRGQGGGGGGFGLPMGGGGGLGIGTVIVLGLVGWALGIDPRILIGGAEMVTRGGSGGSGYERQAPPTPSRTGPAPADQSGRFVAAILGNTEDVWKEVLPAQVNKQYVPAPLVLYTRGTRSGCGAAQSAMGPFYCPLDRKVYLDTSFFQEMQRRFNAGGDFAYAYVIAHEVGHHVQNLLGILPKVQARQREVGEAESNQLSVRVELMADCLAGVWAKNSNQRFNAIDENDMKAAVNAAQAIGDDRLQGKRGGEVMPDSFTHGSSAQRVRWLLTGFKSGQVQSCDTFRASRL
jgi:predicted metalloprotease